MVQCGVPDVIKSIPAGIPQLSDPSPRYSRNIHTCTAAGFPSSPCPCTPLVCIETDEWTELVFGVEFLSPVFHRFNTEIRVLPKIRVGYCRLELCPKLCTLPLGGRARRSSQRVVVILPTSIGGRSVR